MSGNRAERLSRFAFFNETVVPELSEDILHNFCVFSCWRPPKHIEVDSKPVVNFLVDCVVFGA